jgi:hypothetical protein
MPTIQHGVLGKAPVAVSVVKTVVVAKTAVAKTAVVKIAVVAKPVAVSVPHAHNSTE